MHDEGRDYRGGDAIRAWKREADAKYTFVLEPLIGSNPPPAIPKSMEASRLWLAFCLSHLVPFIETHSL